MASTSSYNSYVTGFTTDQLQLPVAIYSWSVLVQSGTAFINGFPVFAGNPAIIGGRDGSFSKMSGGTKIVVGCSGGRVLVTWDA